MMEIWTIGGGEYIVNVFNAVSAWTGGGGTRAPDCHARGKNTGIRDRSHRQEGGRWGR